MVCLYLLSFLTIHSFCPVSRPPDKAEAELAVLSKKGLIDMVLTSDSNALVFGATCVSRW